MLLAHEVDCRGIRVKSAEARTFVARPHGDSNRIAVGIISVLEKESENMAVTTSNDFVCLTLTSCTVDCLVSIT